MLKLAKKRFSLTQKVIIAIIITAITAVIIATISAIFIKPENSIKNQINTLSNDYYENYLYQSILDSPNFSGDIAATLEKYTDTGLTPITLRDLFLHDSQKTANAASAIKKYCNEEQTVIKFYPEAPFTRDAYRTEYNYSCKF